MRLILVWYQNTCSVIYCMCLWLQEGCWTAVLVGVCVCVCFIGWLLECPKSCPGLEPDECPDRCRQCEKIKTADMLSCSTNAKSAAKLIKKSNCNAEQTAQMQNPLNCSTPCQLEEETRTAGYRCLLHPTTMLVKTATLVALAAAVIVIFSRRLQPRQYLRQVD